MIYPHSGAAANRSFPLSAHFSSLFFSPAVYMPQGANVTDLHTGFLATGWFLLTVFCLFFSTYLTLGFNDTDPPLDFQYVPTLQSTGRLL